MMGYVLIVCEKSSVARDFAKALGGPSGNFHGQDYMIVNLVGHVMELDDPVEQVPEAKKAKYKSWSPVNLPWDEKDFAWKKKLKPGMWDVVSKIRSAAAGCDSICCATDVDPTGEGGLLFGEVIEYLGLVGKKPLYRMYHMDESVKEVQKAFLDRKPIPDMYQWSEFRMATHRSRWDFLSMQFTRIATACGDGQSVIREGRLKSGMIKLVGDQLTAIKNYKKVISYQNRFRDEKGVLYTNPDEPIYAKKDQVPKSYQDSRVILDSTAIKHTAPPKYLDLAALSSKLAPKGISAAQVLSTYQDMYQKKIVSYPRTEDKTITPEQFKELLPLVDKIANLVGVNPALLTYREPRKTHVKPQGSHGANRPGVNVPSSLDELTACGPGAVDIYVLLAHNYLATLCEDYEYEQQKGHLDLYPAFTGMVNVPKKPGWKRVFDSGEWDVSDAEDGSGLGEIASPIIYEIIPPKPVTPTMSWMMHQLEKYEVGTGATRTSTYADVTKMKTKYPLLKDTKGKITMTKYGDMSYHLLPGTHIGDLSVTERLEQEMKGVAEGKLDSAVCLAKIQRMVLDDLQVMKQNGEKMRKELGITMAGNNGVQKEKVEGTWEGKQVRISREWGGHKFTDKELEQLFAGETIVVDGIKKKDGSGTYAVKGKLANLSYNGHNYVGFERTGFANNGPSTWCSYTFNEEEKKKLLAGETIYCEGFVSQKKNVFNANVHWDSAACKIVPEFDKK